MIAARCTGCGAGLDPRSSASGLLRCSYCGVTHHAPVGPTQLRAAIREELVVDRNLNGVPDVLEQRPPAVLLPVAGPHRRSASVAWALGAAMAAVFGLGAVGAVISLRAPQPRPEPHVPAVPPVAIPAVPEPTPVATVELAPPAPAPKAHAAGKTKGKPAADQGKTDVSPLALCKAEAASICAYDNEDEADCIRARARCKGL